MNVKNIRKLARHLRRKEMADHFNMRSYANIFLDPEQTSSIGDLDAKWFDYPAKEIINECGTVACIAGHAAILINPDANLDHIERNARNIASKYLGLKNEDMETQLFHGIGYNGRQSADWSKITASIAADVLDNLADTGEVVWPDKVLVEALD